MAYQKLTYSGTECSSYVYFTFYADIFDTERVTNEMGIEPTSVMIKSDPVPKSTGWKYKIEAENQVDLDTPLEKLLDVLEPKIEIINRLKKELKLETRIWFVVDIDIDPEVSTPYFGINKRTIKFISETETEVDYDLYKADTIGLLDDE